MNVRPIRNDDDLSWALAEIERYFESTPAPGSADADRFDVLSALIETYERRVYPVPDAHPAAVLRFAMETLGRSQVELGNLLKSRSRASEILSGKRPLTVDMIRTISAAWSLPPAALLGFEETASAA